ncbi:hypothetical protein ANN_22162 [Periplaneta americana]|uniref:ABC-2 type transporter transmembrane domain-containing protein n=1 Tax=Periplaneta americana TaxID=6978 RepID=A0ABQ8S7D6_PERAM|nr:hypothetical protein ANN_22162 [Periplaneta americana]
MFDDVYVLSEGQCIYNGPNDSLTKNLEEEGFHCPIFYNRADFGEQKRLWSVPGICGITSLIWGRSLSVPECIAGSISSSPLRAIEIASGQRGDKSKLIDKFNSKEVDIECQQEGDSVESKYLLLMHITSRLNPPQLSTAHNIKETAIVIEKDVHVASSYPQPLWRQFLILTKRSLLCTLRDKLCVWVRIVTHLVIGLLLGAVYYNIGNDASKVLSNVSCLFFFVLFLFSCNAMPGIMKIPFEIPVVLHEVLNNWYSLKAYFMSKLVADIPVQVCNIPNE